MLQALVPQTFKSVFCSVWGDSMPSLLPRTKSLNIWVSAHIVTTHCNLLLWWWLSGQTPKMHRTHWHLSGCEALLSQNSDKKHKQEKASQLFNQCTSATLLSKPESWQFNSLCSWWNLWPLWRHCKLFFLLFTLFLWSNSKEKYLQA